MLKNRNGLLRHLLPSPIQFYKSQRIELKGNGEWRQALCPFHNDSKESLLINVEKGAFKCMACNAKGGDVIDFQMKASQLNFVDACKKLGAWGEVEL